jgi:hypothetical protein
MTAISFLQMSFGGDFALVDSADARPIHARPGAHRAVHHVHHRPVRHPVVIAPVRPIPRVRPWYWGTAIAGVTLGTVIAVSAATAPPAPSPELCWFWTDSHKTRGYWDYCTPR